MKRTRIKSLNKLEYYKLMFPSYFEVPLDRLKYAVDCSYFLAKKLGINHNKYEKYIHEAQAMEEVIKIREIQNEN